MSSNPSTTELFPPIDISALLRSHCELSSDQLSSLISTLSDQLASCDEERATLHSKMIQIDAQRAKLRQHLEECRTFQAPIRHLPSEIVAEIFKMTVAATPEPGSALVDAYAIDLALYRLAQPPLHTVSRVCARWHSIAMGTPALWSKIHLDPSLWHSSVTAERAMGLLQSALDRGASHPLNVVVSARYMSPTYHIPAFTRLAAQSARWQSATFECPLSYLCVFAGIRGRLPMLETLTITPTLGMTPPAGTDIFEIAPRLRDFAVQGSFLPFVHTAPLAAIRHIRSLTLASEDIAMAVSTLPRLSTANRFTLQFYLDDFTSNRSHKLDLSIEPTASDVGQLKIELVGEFFTHHCHQALGAIFTALTLPRLEGVDFESEQYPRFPFAWPQGPFLALAQRSAFHTTLHSLCLFHVRITEAQLLQCLAALPALTKLAIADHERIHGDGANVGRGVNLELVSDTLLIALTKASDTPCLVPELDTFSVRSRLRFTDSVLQDFLLSRIEPGRGFTAKLDILPHWTDGRRIDTAVVTKLYELVARGELTITLPPRM
ncbi:hypothetical protein C8R47DRAFT_804814 [Mycena vitilis]|nr:hypothetical protein C8R47DRAFT_804814 [Mycena vitilis]